MKSLWVFGLVLLVGMAGLQAETMQEYLQKTIRLANDGETQEALDRFVWFHQHALEHEPAMYGVRLSFALSYWKKLADVYPPALAAMREIRDRSQKRMASGDGSKALFDDVVAFNGELALNEPEKSLALFELLDRKQPELARKCWPRIRKTVIAAGKYRLARKYYGDAMNAFLTLENEYEENVRRYDKFGLRFQTWNEDNFAEEVLDLVKVADALGQHDVAGKIRARANTLLTRPVEP